MIEKLKHKLDTIIKGKALKNAKERALLENVIFSELNNEEQEIIIKEEIDKIKSSIKDLSLKAALAYIGLDFIIG